MLRLLACKKVYNGRTVLDIPDLELKKGIYWLQGMNGAGKTTLLRIIAGLIPFEGDVRLQGVSLRRSPSPYRRGVAWAEAEPLYPPFIRGQELINFYGYCRKAPAWQAEKLIADFRMQDYITLPVGTYSSGMLKKLSLALAFTGNCPLILLDEPLATLDEEAALALSRLMADYQRDFECSFMFSSHQSIRMDRLALDGQLVMADKTLKPLA